MKVKFIKISLHKDKINKADDLKIFQKIKIWKKLLFFHAKVANDLIKNKNVDLVGFHGQTIYHNSNEKISNQLGDPKLLSQLTKKYNL